MLLDAKKIWKIAEGDINDESEIIESKNKHLLKRYKMGTILEGAFRALCTRLSNKEKKTDMDRKILNYAKEESNLAYFATGMGLREDVYRYPQIVLNMIHLSKSKGDENGFLSGVILSIEEPDIIKDIVAAGREGMTVANYKKFKKEAAKQLKPKMVGDLSDLVGSYL